MWTKRGQAAVVALYNAHKSDRFDEHVDFFTCQSHVMSIGINIALNLDAVSEAYMFLLPFSTVMFGSITLWRTYRSARVKTNNSSWVRENSSITELYTQTGRLVSFQTIHCPLSLSHCRMRSLFIVRVYVGCVSCRRFMLYYAQCN